MHTAVKKTIRLSAVISLVATLSGCLALPPAIQVASLAMDGLSYATTGKSVTDHALSAFAARDCAMLRALQGSEICIDNGLDDLNIDIAVASGPDGGEFKQLSEEWLTADMEPLQLTQRTD